MEKKSAAKQKKADSVDDSNDGNSGSEALSLMVKKFSKFLKYKNKTNNSYAGNKKQSRSGTQTCYECGKTGHIKVDCPVLKMKQKLEEKNEAEKHLKKKKAYIAWEENDSSTSSESDDNTEEENNLCLMAKAESSIKAESSKNSVSSFTYEHEENDYYELLDAFNELHKEATKLQKSNSKRKGEIMWLEGRIKQLEEENEILTTCLEKLEQSEKHSRSICMYCLGQLEKIEYLMKTLSKFTLGRSNLDAVLGSQRSVLNKEGIGYSGNPNRLSCRNFQVGSS